MTMVSEDPTILVVGLVLLGAALLVAMKVTQRGVYLIRAGAVFGLALLVLAIRRATVLATTMESRGFGVDRPRTWARPSRLHPRDAVLVLGAVALTAAAVAAGVLAGTWNPVLG